jgi:hypothetical protein
VGAESSISSEHLCEGYDILNKVRGRPASMATVGCFSCQVY